MGRSNRWSWWTHCQHERANAWEERRSTRFKEREGGSQPERELPTPRSPLEARRRAFGAIPHPQRALFLHVAFHIIYCAPSGHQILLTHQLKRSQDTASRANGTTMVNLVVEDYPRG